jgi:hypothetical protein
MMSAHNLTIFQASDSHDVYREQPTRQVSDPLVTLVTKVETTISVSDPYPHPTGSPIFTTKNTQN